jgi:hypothetical protein
MPMAPGDAATLLLADDRSPGAPAARPVLFEFPALASPSPTAATGGGAANALKPWRHWFTAAPAEAGSSAPASSHFAKELARGGRHYRMTGQQIHALLHLTRSEYYAERGDLAATINELETAAFGGGSSITDAGRRAAPLATPQTLLPLLPAPFPPFIVRHTEVLRRLGLYHEQAGLTGAHLLGAERAFVEMIGLGDVNGRLLMADLKLRRGRPSEALSWALRLPASGERDIALGTIHYFLGHAQEARQHLEQGLRKLPAASPAAAGAHFYMRKLSPR